MIIPQKEQSDQKAIDSAFKENSKAAAKNVKIHLVYAGRYYHNYIQIPYVIYWNYTKLR